MTESLRPRGHIAAFLCKLVLAASLAATVLVSGILIFIEYRQGMDQIEEHLGIVARTHVPVIADYARRGDQDRLRHSLEDIVAVPHIAWAEARAGDGTMIARAGTAPKEATAVRRVFSLVHRNDDPNAPVGALEVAASLKDVYARTRKTAWIVIPFNAAWTLLLAGLIFRLARERVTRPLEALARYAREFKTDDLYIPLRLPGRRAGTPDEIADLETALNAMRGRLRAVHMEEQSRAADLEAEVHARARQLAASEQSLRDAEIFAHRAVEYLADALIVIGPDGIIRRVNPAAERMFGYAAKDLIGANVNLLMPEPHRSAHDGYLARYRQTGQTTIIGQGRELTARRKDGALFPVDLTVAEMKGGQEQLFIGTLRDLTERKKTEQALIEAARKAETADRTKKDFLAVMSHELRTPLNAVLGYTDLMRMHTFGPIGNPRYAEYLDIIHTSGTHLLDLINDILDVSAIEAGMLALREDALDPQALCRDAIRLIAPRAEKGGVRVETRCPGGLPALMADERRIKQILLNLLSNAVKFTPTGGSAAVAARLAPDRAMVFEVADTGIGMNEAEAAKALEPFGQIDTRLSRKYEGAGLGLPLTKSLVELHGGALTIHSAPGQGTTVTVRLPPERTQATPSPLANA